MVTSNCFLPLLPAAQEPTCKRESSSLQMASRLSSNSRSQETQRRPHLLHAGHEHHERTQTIIMQLAYSAARPRRIRRSNAAQSFRDRHNHHHGHTPIR